MEIPIFIGGERTGTLTVTAEGRLTVLDARLRDPGRMVRLRVFGSGEAWYLGVPAPEGDGLRLTRRLSPAAMRGFPAAPRYAAEERLKEQPRPAQGPAKRRVLWLGGRPYYF